MTGAQTPTPGVEALERLPGKATIEAAWYYNQDEGWAVYGAEFVIFK